MKEDIYLYSTSKTLVEQFTHMKKAPFKIHFAKQSLEFTSLYNYCLRVLFVPTTCGTFLVPQCGGNIMQWKDFEGKAVYSTNHFCMTQNNTS